MSVCVDKKRGTYYISYKYKTPLGELKTVNIKNKDWKITGANKVSKRYLQSIEQSIIDKDKKKRGVNYHENNDITLEEALELYKVNRQSNGFQYYTIENEQSRLKTHLLNCFPSNTNVDKAIKISEMARVKSVLANSNLATKTKNMILNNLRDFIKFLKVMKYISRDNADDSIDVLVSLRDTEQKFKEPNYFVNGDEDVNKFFASFENEDKEWLIYFKVLFYSALRIGEFQAITYNDIDFDNNTISITKQIYSNGQISNRTKNGHDKVILLPTQIMLELKQYCENKCFYGNDLIFLSKLGKKVNRDILRQILSKHCEMAQINHITLHGLRHTFATRMIDRQYSIPEIQRQLGHTNMNTTMNFYIHYTENKDKNRNDNLL